MSINGSTCDSDKTLVLRAARLSHHPHRDPRRSPNPSPNPNTTTPQGKANRQWRWPSFSSLVSFARVSRQSERASLLMASPPSPPPTPCSAAAAGKPCTIPPCTLLRGSVGRTGIARQKAQGREEGGGCLAHFARSKLRSTVGFRSGGLGHERLVQRGQAGFERLRGLLRRRAFEGCRDLMLFLGTRCICVTYCVFR